MRKSLLLPALTSIFLLWLFIGNDEGTAQNGFIKKITKSKALQLLDKINIYLFDKSEKQYNVKRQIVSSSYYNGNVCDTKYIFTYTKFDSLQKTIYLAGEQLHGQQIDVQEYDSLNRLHQKLVYTINLAADTFLEEKTAYFYNLKNQRFKSISRLFDKRDTSITTSVFTYTYNPQGLVATRAHTFRALYIPTRTSTTHYTYDPMGRILAKLEEGGDSINYIWNGKGLLTEKRKRAYPLTLTDKYWYDERGNRIKAYFDTDNGRTYEFTYDQHNRLRKVYSTGSLFFPFKFCEVYDYEYY